MTHHRKHPHVAAERFINVTGKLPSISPNNLNRLSVFLTQDGFILSESPLGASGNFQFHVAPHLVDDSAVFAVLGPKGADAESLAEHADLPRASISSGRRLEKSNIQLEFTGQEINDKLIARWWIWCREYTVSGTLETATNCPIGAEVTIYNVTSGVSGLVKTPITTVPTDANGKFTANFNWCSSRLCWWPCWPVWWRCWPWWWELDILAVIDNLERRLHAQDLAAVQVAPTHVAPLRQPNAADLVTGVGFAASRANSELQVDPSRTALIASKFANPALREIFPWWWWCCENPNILFSATQGMTTVLDEDPNTSTRWCFASGQNVALTGNNQSVGACQIQTGDGPCGFAWSSVGSETGTPVDSISMGYAEGAAESSCSNMAFAGTLNLNGIFSGDCAAFYQVLAGDWTAAGSPASTDPARGADSPLTHEPVSPLLTDIITIWSSGSSTQATVVLGPCSFNGVDNLYISRAHRQNPPAGVVGLPPFPAIAPGDLWGWNSPDLVLTVSAADLVDSTGLGGVTLTLLPYDVNGVPLPTLAQPFESGPDLTLAIDTTPLAQATIDWIPASLVSGVYNADGSRAAMTEGSSNTCPSYQITGGSGYVLIHTTVVDDPGHLCDYQIRYQYGNGTLPALAVSPADRNYAQAPSTFNAAATPPPYGVDSGYGLPNVLPSPPPAPSNPAPGSPYAAAAPGNWSFVGGGDTFYIPITLSCCYDFQLWVSKRTTDGVNSCISGNVAYQTVNISVVP